ncbi:MAG: hypothetical protein H6719_34390 [Sandaracinaceae bacterium]|nr:hypothetical protein [Sandaracinaceae bacterium]
MHTRLQRTRIILWAAGAFLLALALGCGSSGDGDEEESAPAAAATVLSRVEQLTPETERSDFEPYERQLDSNRLIAQSRQAGMEPPSFLTEYVLPPTLTDVLMHDFGLTAQVDLDMGTIDQSVTEAQMTQIIAFYVTTSEATSAATFKAHKRFISWG